MSDKCFKEENRVNIILGIMKNTTTENIKELLEKGQVASD